MGAVVGVFLVVAVAVGVVVTVLVIFKCCPLIAKSKGYGAQSHGRYNLAIYTCMLVDYMHVYHYKSCTASYHNSSGGTIGRCVMCCVLYLEVLL